MYIFTLFTNSFLHKLEVKPVDFKTWLFFRQAVFIYVEYRTVVKQSLDQSEGRISRLLNLTLD